MCAKETPATTTEQTRYKKIQKVLEDFMIPGMLSGLDTLHERDIAASKRFLRGTKREFGRVLVVGAGIGCITKALLSSLFNQVDMLEQSLEYVKESEEYLEDVPNMGVLYVSSMQELPSTGFIARGRVRLPERAVLYEGILVQWCVIYSTDGDFTDFFDEF